MLNSGENCSSNNSSTRNHITTKNGSPNSRRKRDRKKNSNFESFKLPVLGFRNATALR